MFASRPPSQEGEHLCSPDGVTYGQIIQRMHGEGIGVVHFGEAYLHAYGSLQPYSDKVWQAASPAGNN